MKKILERVFSALEKQGDNYSNDNEILAGMAENEEEKAAIEQICDEIDFTNEAYDEVKEAYKNGQSPEDWLENELNIN